MLYKIDEVRVSVKGDWVFINHKDHAGMYPLPDNFEEKLRGILQRPKETRGTTEEVFRELFNLPGQDNRALKIDKTMEDG